MPTYRRRLLRAVAGSVPIALAGCTGAGGGRQGTDSIPSPSTGWTYEFDGTPCGTTAHDGRVYVVADGLYAVDAASGDLDWTVSIDGLGDSVAPGFRQGPVIADGAVYVGSTVGLAASLEGDVGWRFDGESLPFTALSSPAVTDGTAVVCSPGSVIALGGNSGDPVWRRSDFTPGAAPTAVDGFLCVPSYPDDTIQGFASVDPGTGETRWTYEVPGAVLSKPAVENGGVVVCGDFESVVAVDADGGDERWTVEIDGPSRGCPIIHDGTVLVGDRTGVGYAIDFETGEELWRVNVGGHLDTTPVVMGEHVCFGSTNGIVVAVDLETGEVYWRYDASGSIGPTLSGAADSVFVATEAESLHAVSRTPEEPGTSTATRTTADDRDSQRGAWPRFQFDRRNSGHDPNGSGPTDTVQPLWTFSPDGSGSNTTRSDPVVSEGMVFVEFGPDVLYAVDATTGEKRWSVSFEQTGELAPPVVDGTLYVAGGEGLYALDATTGTEQWHYEADFGYGQPTVADGTVYVNGQAGIFALDADSGDERWRNGVEGNSVRNMAVVDNTLYTATGDRFLYALDATNGEIEWRFGAETSEVTGNTPPTVVDGMVYFGAHDGSTYALTATDGELQWRFKPAGSKNWFRSSPAVANGSVFTADRQGKVYALDAATGDPQWEFDTGDTIACPPAVVDDTVYIGNFTGVVFALTAEGGNERWTFEAGDMVRAGPAVANGVAYVARSGGTLYALTDGG